MMTELAAPLAALSLLAGGEAVQETDRISVLRAGSQAPTTGSGDYFTGAVSVDSRFQRDAPARIGGALVTFEAGARTAWHDHPLGQTLFVTEGLGRVQMWGGEAEEIRPGDIVWIPGGVKHWHGASPTVGMSHLAVAEALDGVAVTWMEQVSDAEYAGAVGPTP
jgi:quercetin dioxygenase-like cupin family protein